MLVLRYLLISFFCSFVFSVYGQQDMDLHLNETFLAGKNIIKVKRDFHDPYLWVLAQNNEVYRINSVTKVIDNYTSQFSAYSGLQFIDIAGRSQDTVFIATSSSIIDYKKGIIKQITAANGIVGVINSIGVDYTGSYTTDNTRGLSQRPTANTLLIATNSGMNHYDYQREVITSGASDVPAKVFEATYRSEMYSDLEFGDYNDVVTQYAVVELTKYTIYGGFLYLGGPDNIGTRIQSAFYSTGFAYESEDQLAGLDEYVVYANQFWATEKGLFQNFWDYSYQSSNGYKQYLKGANISKITSIYGLHSFGDTYIKENLLIGTASGLYFSNSQYLKGRGANYSFFHYDELGNTPVNDVCTNATSYAEPICEGGVWVAAANGLYLLKPDYVPYIDAAQKIQALTFSGQGFDVSEIQLCNNTSAQATVNGNGENTIQWYKNGQELPNENNAILNITLPGDYYAVLYDPCSVLHFETNHLKVTVIAAPVFSFNYPNVVNACDGSSTTLKTDDNLNYNYRWYTDEVLNNNTTATFNVTKNGRYRVEVSACQGTWVSSKSVTVNFIKTPQPVIAANKAAYCIGDQASLAINFINDGTYTVNWYQNGLLMTAEQNKTTIITNQDGNYTASIGSNLAGCSQVSANYPLIFNAPPAISLQQIINTTLCDGSTITLKATYTGGTIKWSTGETTDQINVTNPGTYIANVATAAGCTATQSTTVQFYPNPVLNLRDSTLCQYTNEKITFTAPTGFAKYEWNGQQGGSSFVTGKLGPLSLTVTDNNGCTTSQTVQISSHCNEIHIPNTFTPNGDGINDTWVIAGINDDLSVRVSVFNRAGGIIFQKPGVCRAVGWYI